MFGFKSNNVTLEMLNGQVLLNLDGSKCAKLIMTHPKVKLKWIGLKKVVIILPAQFLLRFNFYICSDLIIF